MTPPEEGATGPAPRAGDQLGPYLLEEVVGIGGMGRVHAATDTRLGRRVAVKVVLGHHAASPGFAERFQREAAVLARLDSPHVVTIYDHGDHHGHPWIAMQLATGGDLGALLHRYGAMPPAVATGICAQVADALVAAHAVGVVHRDVKPANVLLRDDRLERLHVYLSDFGVALTETTGLTTPGAVAGTWNYLAPERARGGAAGSGSPASDVYAVGCLLWETLTGSPPYTGTDVEVAMAHLGEPVPQLPGEDDLTLRLNRVLALALAKDPAERYPSAARLRDDLRDLGARLTGGSGTAMPALDTGTPAPTRRRRGLLVGVGALVLVLGGVGTAVALAGDGGAPSVDPPPTTGPTGPTGPTGSTDPTAQEPTTGTDGPDGVPEPEPIVQGDLDGDGLGDVAWAYFEDLTVASARPSGGFTEPRSRPFRGPDVLVGDVDGDGVVDLVAIEDELPTVAATTYLRAGDAEARARRVSSSVRAPRPPGDELAPDYLLADVDGDGRDDLVVSAPLSEQETQVVVARSSGDGSFGRSRTYYRGPLRARDSGIAAGDLDGDGDDDLVHWYVEQSLYGNGTFQTLLTEDGRGRTAGGRERVVESSADISDIDEFDVADVDGDGAVELVGMQGYGPEAAVWRWVTDREGWSPADTWFGRDDEVDGALGGLDSWLTDVDGDGRADMATLGTEGIRVLLSTGTELRYAPSWRQRFDPDEWYPVRSFTLSIY